MTFPTKPLVAILALGIVTASCSDDSDSAVPPTSQVTAEAETSGVETTSVETASVEGRAPGIRLVSASEGLAIHTDQPENLVVLDVRTPEEFADGHIEGAIMIDFYGDDFADRLAELDPDVPYLLYCRSGNRSGQTTAIMETLGFTDVADVDGGILSWTEAGNPTVIG